MTLFRMKKKKWSIQTFTSMGERKKIHNKKNVDKKYSKTARRKKRKYAYSVQWIIGDWANNTEPIWIVPLEFLRSLSFYSLSFGSDRWVILLCRPIVVWLKVRPCKALLYVVESISTLDGRR